MSIRRRLAALEAHQGGPNPFADLPDAEISALLAQAADEVPAPTLADARDGLYGPSHRGRFAFMSDDELLRQLDAARAAVAAQGNGRPA